MAVNIKEGIYNYISGKLAENTLGVEFDSSLDIQIDPQKIGYYQLEKNFIDSEQGTVFVETIPAGMIMEETPSGAKGIDKSTWNMTYFFWLTGQNDDDTDFVSQKTAIEELRKELNTNSRFSITVNSDTYNCKAIATTITKIEDITILDKYNRIVMSMAITVVSGIDIKFGDDEIFELQKTGTFTYIDLKAIKKSTATSIEYNSSQPKGTDVAKGVPNRALWQSTVTIIYEDSLLAHQYLYDAGIDNSSFDDILDLRITKPKGGDPIIKKVNPAVAIESVHGVDIKLIVTFTEATLDA